MAATSELVPPLRRDSQQAPCLPWRRASTRVSRSSPEKSLLGSRPASRTRLRSGNAQSCQRGSAHLVSAVYLVLQVLHGGGDRRGSATAATG